MKINHLIFRIDEVKAKLMTNKHIVLVETNEVYSLGNLNSLYNQYLEQGYEGQMVRKSYQAMKTREANHY